MTVKATERSTYLDVSRIDRHSTPFPGIETRTLCGDASGRRTTLTRFAPGARLPAHRHVGLERSFVLDGSLVDDDGVCTAGNYVCRRPGSVHGAHGGSSPDGGVVLGIFDAPNELLS